MCDDCYTPIHAHSEFSALDGAGTVSELVAHYKSSNMPGGFLTDHGTVAGWQPFQTQMAKAGLFAGVGMEAYQASVHRKTKPESYYTEVVDPETGKTKRKQVKPRDAHHLILVAQNERGMRNIKLMSEIAAKEGTFYHPRLDWELLEKYNEGVIATSACLAGLVAKGVENDDTDALNRYLKIFGDRFYLELHAYRTDYQHQVNQALKAIAIERGIPCVPASDAHYCDQQSWPFHEIMLSMQMAGPGGASEGYGYTDASGEFGEPGETYHHPPDLYVMRHEEIASSLAYLGEDFVAEAIANTATIMEQCSDTQPLERKLHLPAFVQAEEVARDVPNNKALLLELMEEGLVERYGSPLSDEVVERAAFEYDAIVNAFGVGERGLEDYFLITWDFIDWCNRQGILTGPGRGSAGGSILAYALGITHVDPLRYGLFFERFWNPGRSAGLPDIDNDVPQAMRHAAKEYLARRWGVKRVRDIGTHVRMGAKSAIDKALKPVYAPVLNKDGKRFYGTVPSEIYSDAAAIKKIIEQTDDAGQAAPWHSTAGRPGIYELVGEELQPYVAKYPELFQVAEWMTGRLATYGVHASAVIVSDVDLDEVLPGRMAKDGDEGEKLVTQVEMNEVEALGFLKMDVLGLRNLDTLMGLLRLVPMLADVNPNTVYKQLIDFDTLPDEAWELLDNKITLGLFQIEDGHAARRIAKEMKPRSIEDLGAIVALNRPGPLRSGMVDRYFARRAGTEPVVYRHEILADILEETYGDFLYQEQVLAYFRAIGYSLGEADDIRRILGKKKVEAMAAEKPRYMERCDAAGITEQVAEAIWDEIQDFSKYSFNKSHAIAYGVILAWTIWAKWRYPTEFIMASIMTNKKKGMERIGAYVNEGRRLGVQIVAPDINRSAADISKVDGEILFGIQEVKGVSEHAAAWILNEREQGGPFRDLEDFRARLELANKLHLKMDAASRPEKSPKQRCGAGMVNSLVNAGAFDALHQDEAGETIYYRVTKEDVPQIRDPSKTTKKDVVSTCTQKERAVYELELIGVSLQDLYGPIVERNGEKLVDVDPISVVDSVEHGTVVSVLGAVSLRENRKLKDGGYNGGKTWASITIEWEGETARFAVWPDQLSSYDYMLNQGKLGVFTLKVTPKGANLVKGELLV